MEYGESPRQVELKGEDLGRMRRIAEEAQATLHVMAEFILDQVHGKEREKDPNPKVTGIEFASPPGCHSAIVYDGHSCGVYDCEQDVCRPCTDAEVQFAQEHHGGGVPI